MKRLAIPLVLLAIMIVGLAILVPQRNTIAEIRRDRAAAAARHEKELDSLRRQNSSLNAELEQIEARENSDVARADRVARTRRLARMQALNQFISVLDSPALNPSIVGGTDRHIPSALEMEITKSWSGLPAEWKAIYSSAQVPAFVVSFPGYLNWPAKFPSGFGELFAIDDTDVRRLDQVLGDTTSGLAASVLETAKVYQDSPTRIRLVTSPIPASATAAYRDRLLGALRETLGEEGYTAFARLNNEHPVTDGFRELFAGPRDFFDAFGAQGHTITIDRTPEGRYNYMFDWTLNPTDRLRGLNGGRGGNMPSEIFRPRLGILSNLLPADF